MRERRTIQSLVLCLLLVIATMNVRLIDSSTHAERELARKLIKLFLAAAVLSPPGLGLFPVPLPLPVPFGIETLKPPIYAPFGFPFLHGGGFGGGLGGYGIGGLGGGGGGYAAAASEMQPSVIALPVVRPESAAAANAITKIPVTLPKFHQHHHNHFNHASVPPAATVSTSFSNHNPGSFSFPRPSFSSSSINFSSYQPSSTSSTTTPSSTSTTSSSTSNHQMSIPAPYSFNLPTPYHFVQPTPNPIHVLG